ncbi:MAG TPA: hypothetical protein VG458_07615 [Solirubrobacterales bacterium]|nr:hypothetical protein [Solirubrobacterales bacterium]
MLNRIGMTLHEARHVRPPVEVEALLMNQIAMSEAQRRRSRAEETNIVENRPGEAAPGWVSDLPVEEG